MPFVTTPNHWHALVRYAGALQAGKHVRRSRACHNLFEGRRICPGRQEIQTGHVFGDADAFDGGFP